MDQQELRAWLSENTSEVALTLAVRAALRVVPKLHRMYLDRQAHVYWLSFFRALAMPWFIAIFDERIDQRFLVAATEAVGNAASISYAGEGAEPTSHAAAEAATAAMRAATAIASNPERFDQPVHQAIQASISAWAEMDALEEVAAKAGYFGPSAEAAREQIHTRSAEFLRAVADDVSFMEDAYSPSRTSQNKRAKQLAQKELWLRSIPDRALEDWTCFKRILLNSPSDWEVWTDWYEDRLYGHPAIQRIEFARVGELVSGEWDQDPAPVNARIKEIIEQNRQASPKSPVRGGMSKQQRAELAPGLAAYNFSIQSGKIRAVPQTGEADDEAMLAEFIVEVRSKASRYAGETASLHNSNPRIHQTAQSIVKMLGDWEAHPAPGKAIMSMRSLQSDLAVYGDALRDEVRATLYDLSVSLSDLIALYPVARKLQAAALALDIQTGDVEPIHAALVQMEDEARRSKAVHDSAIDALAAGREDVEQAAEVISTSNSEHQRAKAHELRADVTAQRMLNAREFLKSAGRACQDGTLNGIRKGVEWTTAKAMQALVLAVLFSWTPPLLKIMRPLMAGIIDLINLPGPNEESTQGVEPGEGNDSDQYDGNGTDSGRDDEAEPLDV